MGAAGLVAATRPNSNFSSTLKDAKASFSVSCQEQGRKRCYMKAQQVRETGQEAAGFGSERCLWNTGWDKPSTIKTDAQHRS